MNHHDPMPAAMAMAYFAAVCAAVAVFAYHHGARDKAIRFARLRSVGLHVALGLIMAAVAMHPDVAHATASAGLPWSGGLNTLSNEAKGGLAFIFVVMGCVGGFTQYMMGAELGMLLSVLARAGIVIGALGGLVTFASLFGMTAAVVAAGPTILSMVG